LIGLINLNPEALQTPHNEGTLPLHMACAGKAEKGVIVLLLDSYPDAVKVRNNDGKLPLHVACETNAPPFTIVSLLSTYPEAAEEKDINGTLPFHHACLNMWCGQDEVYIPCCNDTQLAL
jgi:ankyrin repeat protein